MPNFSMRDPENRHRSIYLLPNAFTTAALFAGFYAVVQAMNDRFETAAIAIFVAMVLDGMDGRVARLTNTQSAFGEQYDSLSDMTSFGVAPALVIYEWILQDLGRWGWLAIDNKLPIHDSIMAWVAFVLTMYAGVAMVSNASFFSGKNFALGRSVPFWGILLVVAVFVFVSSDPPVVLFGLFVLYGLSGWVVMAWRWNRARRLQQERRSGHHSP
ncbi:CDP-diacylglycerol--serine O-phosphatidyltransferase protein [Bordetella pertussis]|nr:CDP-diacylglycerol--serine O-phosphatidyltransferase protein [Bordetella pertussis]